MSLQGNVYAMDLVSLPDIGGMLVLMCVLLWFRSRNEVERVDGWLLGLTLILIEMIASAIIHGSGILPLLTHVVSLDAYLLAAVAFGWAARQDLLPDAEHIPFFLLPAAPLLMLATIYGLNVTSVRPYLLINAGSVVFGLVYLLFFLRLRPRARALLVLVHLLIWAPMLYLSANGDIHRVVYWGLGCLYILVALSFRSRLRFNRIGVWVIMVSFLVWALCFLVYPNVEGSAYNVGIVEQIWNLQKFFVVIGMLLVLLEDEMQRRKDEAMHDALTGLPNRRLFEDRLELALQRSRRSGVSMALFVIDLNGFKEINDSFGHQMGDAVLTRVADRLKRKTRAADTIARCGGDEFFIIVNDLSRKENCIRIAESLRSEIESVTLPGQEHLRLSGSIGYAVFPDEANEEKALCALADHRMYAEKQAGTQVRVPTESLR